MFSTMKEVRRYWLEVLIHDRFDGDRGKFLEATKLTKGRPTQYLTDGFGDVAAKNLLGRLSKAGIKLQSDYFDRPIPKPESDPLASVTSLPVRAIPAVEAFEIFAAAVNKLAPGKRNRVMESAGAYAADLSDENERQYVIRELSGELPSSRPRRRQVNGK